MRKLSLTALAALGALGACASGSGYEAPTVAIAPAHSVTQSAQLRPATTTNPFWREIGDSTLSHLVTEALRSNTDLHVAEAHVDASRASHRLAAYDYVPTVSANGTAMRSKQSVAQAYGVAGSLPQVNLYDMGVDASLELDVFGRIRRNVAAQGALVSASQHSLDEVRIDLAAEVARAYFELRGAQQQLAVALRNADVQRRTLAITEDRLAAGRGAGFDVARARSVLQLTLASVPELRSQISAHLYRIATLLGRTPDAVPTELTASAAMPVLPESVSVASPRQLIRNRPDVLAAERQVAAQSLFVSAAQSEYLPHFALGASLGYTSTQVESWTRNGNSRLLFGPTVSLPLLDIGRVRERVGVAQAAQQSAQAQYTATVLRALEETEVSIVAYDRAHERVSLLTSAVSSSSTALDLAQQRFEAGLTDFLQVLDAENQLTVARTSAGTALVSLYKSVGGSWSTP